MDVSNFVEFVTPWFLQPSSLNSGEDEALRKARTQAPTISRDPQGSGPMVGRGPTIESTGRPVVKKVGIFKPTWENGMQVPTKVVERLGPYLTRVAATSKDHWNRLVAALDKKGIKVASVNDLVKFSRENWLQVGLVLFTMAEVGLSVGDLFSSEDKADKEVRATAMKLDSITLGVDTLIGDAAAKSASLSLGIAGREVEMATMGELCRWAKSHFGSVNAALDAHQKMQAFQELSYADLEAGFRYLK